MKTGVVLVILLWLSAEDIREGMLSMQVVFLLGITGLFHILCNGHAPVWQPGVVLLLTGKLTRERIGYGDGWLILSLGMWLTLEELLFLLIAGMLFAVLYGIFFRKKELPFVPFLTAGYLLELWVG